MARSPIMRCSRCGTYSRERPHCKPKRRAVSSPCALYHTKRWKAYRDEWLSYNPLCNDCDGLAVECHHIIKHHCDEEKFWSSPLMSLCRSCHAIRSARGE